MQNYHHTLSQIGRAGSIVDKANRRMSTMLPENDAESLAIASTVLADLRAFVGTASLATGKVQMSALLDYLHSVGIAGIEE